jgi:TatA/E family protein of Tat protein translocase
MGLGLTHLLVIAIVVLLLFSNRLPSVMRSLGEGTTEFKRGLTRCPRCGARTPFLVQGCWHCGLPRHWSTDEPSQEKSNDLFVLLLRKRMSRSILVLCAGIAMIAWAAWVTNNSPDDIRVYSALWWWGLLKILALPLAATFAFLIWNNWRKRRGVD